MFSWINFSNEIYNSGWDYKFGLNYATLNFKNDSITNDLNGQVT
jgi:hypothetical protein